MGKPELTCDLVMKGGITSGVIYPGVIDKLKDKYQFRSIGGTSAGAIAATLLAAAEYRRQVDDSYEGFDILRDLPNRLGQEKEKRSLLFRLFEPHKSTRNLFDLMTSFLRSSWTEDKPREPIINRLPRILYSLGKAYWYLPLIIFIATLLLLGSNWDMLRDVPSARATFVICLVLLAGLITLLAFVAAFVRDVSVNLVGNHLGLCRGSGDADTPASASDALCDWLERTLDEAAGLKGTLQPPRPPDKLDDDTNILESQEKQGPLTFAHLKTANITLKMFTTCLSRGIPLTLPFAQKAIYFKPKDLEGYFSQRIIDYLIDFARPSNTATKHNEQNKLKGRYDMVYVGQTH